DVQNGNMIISAINIWRKYGGTLNDGLGNYLNWYRNRTRLILLNKRTVLIYLMESKPTGPVRQNGHARSSITIIVI
ncbi:MAG: hypothetical protein L0H53_16555, partial [Candidatus Nitrosocosmicus sp.]|nr:hypothetical protein [Candidatus Nitrosocosmicus sp.]